MMEAAGRGHAGGFDLALEIAIIGERRGEVAFAGFASACGVDVDYVGQPDAVERRVLERVQCA